MSKQAKKNCVPVLRFPEFREAGEWENVQLGQCLIKHPEYGINAPAVPFSENLPTYLRITDISEDGYFIENQKVSVNKKVTIENYLNEGDIVFARTGASVGKSYKYRLKDGKLVFAGFLIRVKPNEKKLNSELLFQFLSTEQYWRWVNLTSARSGQPGINGNEYSLLPIPLPPSLEEQQKIAACLSSLDELITAQAQKVEALKTHKKGLMQQLFPAEGETVPKLRFPEFLEAGEWEIKPLGNIADFSSGGTPSKENSEYWGGDIPWISAASMYSTNIESSDLSITEKAIKNGAHIAKKGTLLILVRGSMLYKRIPIGVTAKDVAFNQDVKALSIDSNIFNYFLLYQLIAFEWQLLNLVSATGIGAGKIDTMDLKQFRVFIAPQEEQQKIAACLSSLDELITAQAQKLEALKTHKKGLMQQLFPAVDEATE